MLWVQRPVQRPEDNVQPGRVFTSSTNVRRSVSTPERDPKMIWDTIRADNLGRYNNTCGASLATERLNRWRESESSSEGKSQLSQSCSGRAPIRGVSVRDSNGDMAIIYRI